MLVLGIADNHDSGAALVRDGALIAAVNQERFDRVKNSGAFPWEAIDGVLVSAGARPEDVDRVVIGTGFTPSAPLRAMPSLHHQARGDGQFSDLLHVYILYQSAARRTGLHTVDVDLSRRILERRLAGRGFTRARLEMMDHHRAHAEAAYRTQGADRCLVLTVDAMGDGTTATASLGHSGQLDLLWRQSGRAAVGTFYSRITQVLGFRPNRHEGKITGLAAYATPPDDLLAHLRTRLSFVGPGFSKIPWLAARENHAFWRSLSRWSREEIAAGAQRVLEESVTAFVRHHVRATGCGAVAVAGGIFANVKLNQRVAALPEVTSLWVVPHMGDGGLSVGAALGSTGAAPAPLASACLGGDITAEACTLALGDRAPPRVPDPVDRVADLLAAGAAVARCAGRMEWGPRALGNRSVLALPSDPSINETLNARLRRSEFMPFAPMVRAEDAVRFFVGTERARRAARFMTVCFDVRPEFAERCPAATHVDRTARPQLVDADRAPELHRLLTAVGERTGTPVLINTSFNLHEEPIVRTPSDALRAFDQAELDALWLGPYVLESAALDSAAVESGGQEFAVQEFAVQDSGDSGD